MADVRAVEWYEGRQVQETAGDDPSADDEVVAEGYIDDQARNYANAAVAVAR